MTGLLQTIVAFVLVLGAMIVIHEFGHFIVAKLFGIRVDVFSIGFGKRLWGFRRGDTDYRVSLIPLGGYVKMAGENLDEKATGAPVGPEALLAATKKALTEIGGTTKRE